MAFKSQVTITRPANVTPYNAGDVVGGAFQFTGIPNGYLIAILYAALLPKIADIPAGMTSFTLHLYDRTPPSALADNAPFDLTAADAASYLGKLDVGSPADRGASLHCEDDFARKVTLTGGTGLWAYLVTNGAFTPAANSEQYLATLIASSI